MSMKNERVGDHGAGHQSPQAMKMYLQFGAMILTAMVVMYALMFVSSYRWSHVGWSESRAYMALTMGGAMGLVMLAWMKSMYRNTKFNIAIVAISVVLLGGGAALDRTQAIVQDVGYMSSMIPHHSMAITRSEHAELSDVRVCELAVAISEAQRREIAEMNWLIDDIQENGEAETPQEAAARPVPDFEASAERQCSTK